jgi:sterol desaturase/sphingolipid hydroxylase (fatty acid hydroxylase superfamily)
MTTTVNSLRPSISASQLQSEAQKARRRFLPATAFYTTYSLAVLTLSLRSRPAAPVLAWFGGGMVAWTLLEYLVHRYVLHGRFPAGPGVYRRFTHRFFDPLHWEHHARPWDSNHINGTLKDTLPFSAVFIALGLLTPRQIGAVFVAGLLRAYVIEEWVHQSVHYNNFNNRYFRYIRRHHLYHHSPKGMNAGYGLTNGFWDVVWSTRFPPEEREALYGRTPRGPAASRAGSRGPRAHPPAPPPPPAPAPAARCPPR